MEVLAAELVEAEATLARYDGMSEEEVIRKGQQDFPTEVFTSTLPITRETGAHLFNSELEPQPLQSLCQLRTMEHDCAFGPYALYPRLLVASAPAPPLLRSHAIS